MSKSVILFVLLFLQSFIFAQFNIEWEVTTDGGYGRYDDAKIMKITDDAIYVAGVTLNASSEDDVILIKYDFSGNVVWSKIEDIGGYDKPIGLEFDQTGNIYLGITGQSDTNSWGERDFILLKYQSDGSEVIKNQINHFVSVNGEPYNVLGQASSMRKNSFGRFAFCGIVANGTWFVSIEQTGSINTAVLDTLPLHTDLPYANDINVVFDPASNAHYIGYLRYNDAGPAYKSVFLLAKVNHAGELLWEKNFYEFPGKSMYAVIADAEFRSDGGAYFNIQLRQASGVNDGTFYYPHLLGLHNNGDVIFDEGLPVLPGNDTEFEFTGMALDQGGNIWVTGDQDYKYFVSKYSTAGEKIWEVIDSSSQKGHNVTCDGYTGIVASMDGEGNVFIKKYNFNGEETISHKLQGVSNINGITTVDIQTFAGNYYFVGNKGASAQDVYLVKFNDPSTSVSESDLPVTFVVPQNYPNPFNPETVIYFTLDRGSDISLTIYNSIGVQVKELYSGFKNAGEHYFRFNASGLASGVYFCELKYNNKSYTNKMLLLK